MSLESIILQLSYLGVFLLMIANGMTYNPSSQVLYIIAGYFVYTGNLNFWLLLIAGTLGNTAGNIAIYEIARRRGAYYIIKKFRIFRKKELRKVQAAFSRKGALFLFIAKFISPLKVLACIAAGLGKMNRILYNIITVVTSFIWACIFIAIGYFFGKGANIFKAYIPIMIIMAAAVLYLFYRYMNSKEIIKEID